MEGLFRFLHILAWFGMILFFLRAVLTRYAEVQYYRSGKIYTDLGFGRIVRYNWINPLITSILCGIWLFAFNQFDPLFAWMFR